MLNFKNLTYIIFVLNLNINFIFNTVKSQLEYTGALNNKESKFSWHLTKLEKALILIYFFEIKKLIKMAIPRVSLSPPP